MYGSLINRVLEGARQPDPEVGMGATVNSWSDRNPATVTELVHFKSGARKGQIKGFKATHDKWKVVSGSTGDGSAKYTYTQDPDSPPFYVGLTKRGWRIGGTIHGDGVTLGSRERYEDPHR